MKLVTDKTPVRFSYAHVHEPQSMVEGGVKKYSVCVLIPKTNTEQIAKINAAINAALEEGIKKLGGKIPTVFKNPLRDGDLERPDNEECVGMMFFNANSTNPPGLFDAERNAIMDANEFYSGCYGRASVDFYAYNYNGTKGVAVGLNRLQKLEEGERLSGDSGSAESDFGDDDDML